MVNEKNIYLAENKKAQIEEVREIDYKVPSYEEFIKTYEIDKEVISSYDLEVGSYDDIRIKGTYYGPGFWDDIKDVVKPIATGALVVASVFPPTAAVAAPAAYFVIGTGAAAVGLGHVADDKDMKELGKDLLEIGMGSRDGQGATESPQGVKQGSLNEYARSRK